MVLTMPALICYHKSMSELKQQPRAIADGNPEREALRIKYNILTLENYRKRMVDEQQLLDIDYLDDDRLRAFYVMRTDRLIQEAESEEVDTMLYLDKSARPIQWMVREFWPIFAGDKPMPESKFVNIDASTLLGRSESEPRPDEQDIYDAKIPEEVIQELRTIFIDPSNRDVSMFDGKKVMVVDEVSVSGGTLSLAVKILSEAFPRAEFVGRSWMTPEKVKRGYGIYPKELPVWYHKIDPRGRGVGDLKPGSRVLSAPGAEMDLATGKFRQDELSKQLRAEVKQLAKDVKEGRQSIIPGYRGDEAYYDMDPSSGQPREDGKGHPVSSKFKIRYVN